MPRAWDGAKVSPGACLYGGYGRAAEGGESLRPGCFEWTRGHEMVRRVRCAKTPYQVSIQDLLSISGGKGFHPSEKSSSSLR